MNDWRYDVIYSSGDIVCSDGTYFKLSYGKDINGNNLKINSQNEYPAKNSVWQIL